MFSSVYVSFLIFSNCNTRRLPCASPSCHVSGHCSSKVGLFFSCNRTSRRAPAGKSAVIKSIRLCSKCLGNDNGLKMILGLKLNITLARTSTPRSFDHFCMFYISNMPGKVRVKSKRNCLGCFWNFNPYLKFLSHCSKSSPVLMYSPIAPVPSKLAHICQSRK